MAQAKKVSTTETAKRQSRPALSPEARENQLIALAVNCAEEQLRNGTASSQVITHYLKLASSKTSLELEKLKKENELLAAKTEAIKSAAVTEELYRNAIAAMTEYQGRRIAVEDEYDEY